MSKVFIVTGHGKFAAGVKSSLDMLLGAGDDLYFVDFEETDSDVTLKEKFSKILSERKDAEVLFICDLLGGTPYKVAAQLANETDKIEVVAGCNIGSIMEAFMGREEHSLSDLADFIVDVSKNFTIRFKKVNTNSINTNQDFSEGI
ncbi:PTS sugar transporter subunit IIA [Coprothermobacter platensis]|uniref:PTS sugar transporter subunit IIA n=1 Tax=Coprothermobacter platensis TaxID=108819 RepID=UPI00037D9F10|nr:PTS sugar transporter subunit IIA [Coprothermobacter platensis]